VKYNICTNEGERASVTVFIGGEQFVATREHPNFNTICDGLQNGLADKPDEVRNLFDASIAIGKKFERLSERVSANAGKLFFDGTPVDDSLTKAIIAFHAANDPNFKPLVNFMEKVATNPNDHSREQLFSWLARHDFSICEDGDFIAYKGVDRDFYSSFAGRAIVNGEAMSGKIPWRPGTIVEMPREEVKHDPHNGCSTGLHVANWRFAVGWNGDKTLRCKINPRDVVSVPTDSDFQKMRVCRAYVIDEVQREDTTHLHANVVEKLARVAEPKPKPEPKRAVFKKKGKKVERPSRKPAPAPAFPSHYELFKPKHFAALSNDEVQFVARAWEVPGRSVMGRDQLNKALHRIAKQRLATWPANDPARKEA
jgi:hypothetical protein